MSGAIKINGTSSGSTTITAPASGGDETIELSTALAAKADYEQGTFSPTVYGSTTAGTVTYTFQNGYYAKVGHVVTFVINVGWNSLTGTGDLIVGGLPYTSVATHYAAVSVRNDGVATTYQNIQGYVEASTNYIKFSSTTTSGSQSVVVVDALAARLMVAGSYFTAS